MKNLIVCLGYELSAAGDIPLVLENRLNECIRLAKSREDSTLLLLGGRSFRDIKKESPIESKVMHDFIITHASDIIPFTKIVTEEQTTSTVEQICYLREFIAQNPDLETITVVSSEFFNERVKLYARYILNSTLNIEFIPAKLPDNMKQDFEIAEANKLKKAEEWLSHHQIGDHKIILQEQLAFQKKILESNKT